MTMQDWDLMASITATLMLPKIVADGYIRSLEGRGPGREEEWNDEISRIYRRFLLGPFPSQWLVVLY